MMKLEKLLLFLKPAVQFIGKLHFPYTHKKIRGTHYYRYRSKFKQGDLFLTSIDGELSNILNPSAIKHGAIFFGPGLKTHLQDLINRLGDNHSLAKQLVHVINEFQVDDEITYIIEAVGKGVIPTDLVTFMTTKDRFIHVKHYDAEIAKKASKQSTKYLGRGYDYSFVENNVEMYCFELCAQSYLDVDRELMDDQLVEHQMVKGKKIYDSSTFLDHPEYWTVVVDSKEE